MLRSVVVDLRERRVWEPGALVVSAFEWPRDDWPMVRLSDVALAVSPHTWVDEGTPVVTPGSLDPLHGGVRRRTRRHHGSVYQIGSSGPGIRFGDVLVPPGNGPALLATEELAGAVVSSRFAVLRPAEWNAGVWIWAVLSSRSGRAARAGLADGALSSSVTASALLDLDIPWPPADVSAALTRRLEIIEQTTHGHEEEPRETWWREADLRQREWRLELATPDPGLLSVGEPLESFCVAIERGRRLPDGDVSATPGPDLLPVADVSALSGGQPRKWAAAAKGRATIAMPGDILTAEIGDRPYATVVRDAMVVDPHVFVLRLREIEQGPALARYLNGQAGYGLRQIYLQGSTVPGLRQSDLAKFRVPLDALHAQAPEIPDVPLATALEQVLWR